MGRSKHSLRYMLYIARNSHDRPLALHSSAALVRVRSAPKHAHRSRLRPVASSQNLRPRSYTAVTARSPLLGLSRGSGARSGERRIQSGRGRAHVKRPVQERRTPHNRTRRCTSKQLVLRAPCVLRGREQKLTAILERHHRDPADCAVAAFPRRMPSGIIRWPGHCCDMRLHLCRVALLGAP